MKKYTESHASEVRPDKDPSGKKLRLRSERLRLLNSAELSFAGGGGGTTGESREHMVCVLVD